MTADGDGSSHWFEPIAEHLGSAYLRYSFTKGTIQEVDHLVRVLGLVPGSRVLDVGCGPGRHALELARRGMVVHGVDISRRFVDLASAADVEGASFEVLDARRLGDADHLRGAFDAVICLCQGAFGLQTGPGEDEAVLRGIASTVRSGGRVALSAFNAYFVVTYQTDATFDAATGINHERTEVRDESGRIAEVDLWTGCYTPRELRLLCAACGLSVDAIAGVEPGAYGDAPPTVDLPEFLVLATRT